MNISNKSQQSAEGETVKTRDHRRPDLFVCTSVHAPDLRCSIQLQQCQLCAGDCAVLCCAALRCAALRCAALRCADDAHGLCAYAGGYSGVPVDDQAQCVSAAGFDHKLCMAWRQDNAGPHSAEEVGFAVSSLLWVVYTQAERQ